MADFIQARASYAAAGNNFRKARHEQYLLRQQSIILEREVNGILATGRLTQLPPGHPKIEERNQLAKRLAEAGARLAAAEADLAAARQEFLAQGDVRRQLPNLDDGIPILLMPLKLQTRFLTVKHIARNCPDELLVDVATVNRVMQARIHILVPNPKPATETLRGVSAQQALLSNLDNPSALQLIQQLNTTSPFLPPKPRWLKVEDKYELLVRIFPDDIFMQTHETALTAQEIISARAFWQEMWAAETTFHQSAKDEAAQKTYAERQLAAWRLLNQAHMPHRAAWLARSMRPGNFPEEGQAPEPEPDFPEPGVKSEAWTLPPRAELLPEQFGVRLTFNDPALPVKEILGTPVPESLQLGLDPDETEEDAFAEKLDTLQLPAAIRWLTDFDEAERVGMAVRIPLNKNEIESGIAKVVVLGVKTGADAAQGARLLEELFENHRFRPDGMAFLPPGTPTNNLPGMPSGFSRAGASADDTFSNEFPPSPFSPDPDSDGRRFARALGLRPESTGQLFNQQLRECSQALSMNRALWPATFGYFLDQLMRPSVKTADIAFIKDFFQNSVAGRGLLPPFRVGKQPYGIVPASSLSMWQADPGASPEEKRLLRVLKKLDGEWQKLSGQVKTMKSVFSQQNEEAVKQQFRELLSLQASSTRFFRRLVAGEYLVWNLKMRNAPAGTEKSGVRTTPAEYKAKLESSAAWGEAVNPIPRILGKFLEDENYKLTDFQPVEQLGPNARTPDDKNYLSLLLDLTFEQLRDRQFGDTFSQFVKHRSSRLAFYVARFALLQAWVEAATKLVRKANIKISPFAQLDFETEYMAVMISNTQISEEHKRFLESAGEPTNVETRKNKWAFLEERIGAKRVADLIQEKLTAQTPPDKNDPVRTLFEVRQALQDLSVLSDEQLERLLSEHFDLCGFRLDAWLQGLSLARLSARRAQAGFEQGVFLGAYGYVENLRPASAAWVRVKEVETPPRTSITGRNIPPNRLVMPVYDFSKLTAAQKQQAKRFSFVYLGSDPQTRLVEDPLTRTLIQQQAPDPSGASGFLLTPSPEHAATAAILHAGFEHHARSQGPESRTLSVNLSPERTGRALDMLKAVQAGHSINEQLGYFIERAMYETETVSLAEFVLEVRKQFPLHVEVSEWDDQQKIGEAKIENLALVTDGLRLLTEKNKSSTTSSAWNSFLLAVFGNNTSRRSAFLAIVDRADQLFDALSDLLLAESVFQTVKGSPERAAAALRTASEGTEITLPELTKMPLQSHLFSHRMGFVQKAVTPANLPWPTTGPVSLWAQLSPDLNRWLADQLPAPDKICAVVATENGDARKVFLAATGLQAIDLYYLLLKTANKPELSLLPAFLLHAAGRPERTPSVVRFEREATFTEDECSIRELLPLLDCLGRLLAKSRPMRPADWQISAGNSPRPSDQVFEPQLLAEAVTRFSAQEPTSPIPEFLKKLEAAITVLSENQPVGFPSPETEAAFFHLFGMLPEAFWLGVWDAKPVCPENCTAVHVGQLLEQAVQVAQRLRVRLGQAAGLVQTIQLRSGDLSPEEQFDGWAEAAKVLSGEELMILPRFHLENPDEIRATYEDEHLLEQSGAFAVEEWLQGVATVRDNARNYLLLQNLRELVPGPAADRSLKIMQLPFLANAPNKWVGGPLPPDYEPAPAATSLAFELQSGLTPEAVLSGILFEEWREQMPAADFTGGASIHYNQPNQEAPQALLLAITPQITGRWNWSALIKIVEETFELAKKRGVDTELLQGTWLSQFLPALIAPLDAGNNTANLDFGLAGPPVLPNIIIVDGPGNILTKSN